MKNSENKIENTLNEFGDRIGFPEVSQGVILMAIIGGLVACACIRGCQELKKRSNQTPEKAKIVLLQNQR